MGEVQDQCNDHTNDIPADCDEVAKIFPHWLEKTLQSKFVEKNPDHCNYVVAILTTEHSLL